MDKYNTKMPEGDEINRLAPPDVDVARSNVIDHINNVTHDARWCLLCIDQEMINTLEKTIETLRSTIGIQKQTVDTQKTTIKLMDAENSLLKERQER